MSGSMDCCEYGNMLFCDKEFCESCTLGKILEVERALADTSVLFRRDLGLILDLPCELATLIPEISTFSEPSSYFVGNDIS